MWRNCRSSHDIRKSPYLRTHGVIGRSSSLVPVSPMPLKVVLLCTCVAGRSDRVVKRGKCLDSRGTMMLRSNTAVTQVYRSIVYMHLLHSVASVCKSTRCNARLSIITHLVSEQLLLDCLTDPVLRSWTQRNVIQRSTCRTTLTITTVVRSHSPKSMCAARFPP